MRFLTLIPTLYALSTVAAPETTILTADHHALVAAQHTAANINAGNCYGAPTPPWQNGCKPGWYYGRQQFAPIGLVALVDNLLCAVLRLLLGCSICPGGAPPTPPPPPPVGPTPPPPPPAPKGYDCQFTNLTCASEVWPPPFYLTYGIVESIQGCANMCDSIPKCIFFNTYHDVNAGTGKHDTTQLTCALFSVVLTAANATNCGHQQQKPLPAGETFITDSYGYSKSTATIPH
ncbi:hypothetical protein C8R43DRAFT_1145144 [Mycena crocata]|nr:hypothetical protein C8R43DRAFT_1145144 [Mycena crocata]